MGRWRARARGRGREKGEEEGEGVPENLIVMFVVINVLQTKGPDDVVMTRNSEKQGRHDSRQLMCALMRKAWKEGWMEVERKETSGRARLILKKSS